MSVCLLVCLSAFRPVCVCLAQTTFKSMSDVTMVPMWSSCFDCVTYLPSFVLHRPCTCSHTEYPLQLILCTGICEVLQPDDVHQISGQEAIDNFKPDYEAIQKLKGSDQLTRTRQAMSARMMEEMEEEVANRLRQIIIAGAIDSSLRSLYFAHKLRDGACIYIHIHPPPHPHLHLDLHLGDLVVAPLMWSYLVMLRRRVTTKRVYFELPRMRITHVGLAWPNPVI